MRLDAQQCQEFVNALAREAIMVQAVDNPQQTTGRPATRPLGIRDPGIVPVVYSADTGGPGAPAPASAPAPKNNS